MSSDEVKRETGHIPRKTDRTWTRSISSILEWVAELPEDENRLIGR